jgi:5-(carboxyamino)imidazole ribonucleotide mutase
MGSSSDLKHLQPAIDVLNELSVPHEAKIVSAHRTPDWMFEYASTAEDRGIEVIIAAAGGAAHLPGMVAAKTVVPVLGVPVPATTLNGLDSLLSIVQMPKGVPVGTLAIGESGAVNAALLATSIVSINRADSRNCSEENEQQPTGVFHEVPLLSGDRDAGRGGCPASALDTCNSSELSNRSSRGTGAWGPNISDCRPAASLASAAAENGMT